MAILISKNPFCIFDQMKTQTSEASSLSHPKNSMGNETREEKQENKSKGTKERLNKDKRKEVIISVYVESPSPHSINAHRKEGGGGDRHNDAKKSNNKSRPVFISKNPQAAKPRGYDRRAQLLAYARELRQNPDTEQPEWPINNSKPKPKANIVSYLELKAGPKQMSMKKLSNPVRIEFAKSRKKYHRLVPEVDISCQPKSIILRNEKNIKNKKKANRHTDFRFVGKLRGIMTGFCKE